MCCLKGINGVSSLNIRIKMKLKIENFDSLTFVNVAELKRLQIDTRYRGM